MLKEAETIILVVSQLSSEGCYTVLNLLNFTNHKQCFLEVKCYKKLEIGRCYKGRMWSHMPSYLPQIILFHLCKQLPDDFLEKFVTAAAIDVSDKYLSQPENKTSKLKPSSLAKSTKVRGRPPKQLEINLK